MKPYIFLFLFSLIYLSIAVADDLSDYPDFFIEDNLLNVSVVVGNEAPSRHVLAQTEIILSLSKLVDKPVSGLAKLSSEIANISGKNLISIGNACKNNVTARILKNPEPCDKGIYEGKATIELFESESGDHYTILNSLSDNGINEAASILANYQDFDLDGNIYEIDLEEDMLEDEALPETKKEGVVEEDADEPQEVQAIHIRRELAGEQEPEIADKEDEPEQIEPAPLKKEDKNIIMKIIAWIMSIFR